MIDIRLLHVRTEGCDVEVGVCSAFDDLVNFLRGFNWLQVVKWMIEWSDSDGGEISMLLIRELELVMTTSSVWPC